MLYAVREDDVRVTESVKMAERSRANHTSGAS